MKTIVQGVKEKIYEELSKITKALGNAKRLEIIDLLAQGPLSVEKIASYTNMSVANASKHLQVLKSARLVDIIRRGNFIDYSLAGEKVYNVWETIRELGENQNVEIKSLLSDYRGRHNEVLGVTADELLSKMSKGEAILLDVRPEEEYKRGHIHKAISMPIEELKEKVKLLPKDKEIIAYCRGKFCFLADEAVTFLKEKGYNVTRVSDGFSEWKMQGYPVEMAQ